MIFNRKSHEEFIKQFSGVEEEKIRNVLNLLAQFSSKPIEDIVEIAKNHLMMIMIPTI